MSIKIQFIQIHDIISQYIPRELKDCTACVSFKEFASTLNSLLHLYRVCFSFEQVTPLYTVFFYFEQLAKPLYNLLLLRTTCSSFIHTVCFSLEQLAPPLYIQFASPQNSLLLLYKVCFSLKQLSPPLYSK